ncbi:MAG: hypothetical protein SPI30_08195 [Prevotella sp.]|nr:hypothetical protein [Prevotella sp.]
MSSRLYVAFDEGVADYAEKKRRRKYRQADESRREANSGMRDQ